MRVNHSTSNVTMSQKLLNCTDIVICLEQMAGKFFDGQNLKGVTMIRILKHVASSSISVVYDLEILIL